MRATAESTKLRIVYDASARAFNSAPSLNDCLNTGPPLQNKLWSVLVRGHFNPVAITGDLQKAFLQVRVKEIDRDAMHFHWHQDEQSPLETLRFTRALFGLAPSPFLLGGVIEMHFNNWEERKPELVAKIRKELYVDDLISGSTTVCETRELRLKKSSKMLVSICTSGTQTSLSWNQSSLLKGIQSTRQRTNSLTPTRHCIKSSRDVSELVLNPIQLIRS